MYTLYRKNDESTDKVEGDVIWLAWSNFDILAMLTKRIITYFGGKISEDVLNSAKQQDFAEYLGFVFTDVFEGTGKWESIPTYRLLTSLIRKRPRDLVKLCFLAAHEARKNKHSKIETNDFNSIFEKYSQERLQDTINEFRSELPEIEKLLLGMKPTHKEKTAKEGYTYSTADLLKKVKNISSGVRFQFAFEKSPASPQQLCAFMYKINFITARKTNEDGKIIRKYFEENNFLMNNFSDFGFEWEVHPAYRWALQPESVKAVFDSLEQYGDV